MDSTEKRIVELIDLHRQEIIDFATDIYTHAELGFREYRTAGKFREILSGNGLRIVDQLAITGVKGYLNEDKKDSLSVALIGEMDALKIPDHRYANPETGVAHCCGHHAQLAGVVGALYALTDREVADTLGGQVIFFAVPAEEYGEAEFKARLIADGRITFGGGKCELIAEGAFDDVDIALAHHTRINELSVGSGTNNGFVAKVIRIKGKAAHAAAGIHEGVNALKAASLGLQALAFNTETFRDEDSVRVHPIITNGGDQVNVIPGEAVVETLVRGKTTDAIIDAANKTDRSFKAGAYALGAHYRIETTPGYLPTLPQPYPEELIEAVAEAAGRKPKLADVTSHRAGSTDLGDVQHLLPVYTFNTGGASGSLHGSDFSIDDEEEAYILTAKIFALETYRLLRDGAVLGRRIKSEYRPVFKNSAEYVEFLNQFRSVEEG